MVAATANLALTHGGFSYLGPAKWRRSVSPRSYQYLSTKPPYYVHGIIAREISRSYESRCLRILRLNDSPEDYCIMLHMIIARNYLFVAWPST